MNSAQRRVAWRALKRKCAMKRLPMSELRHMPYRDLLQVGFSTRDRSIAWWPMRGAGKKR